MRSKSWSYAHSRHVAQGGLCDVSKLALLSHIPRMRTCAYRHHVSIMTKSRRQEPSQKFTEQWQSCRDWLLPFMQNNQPKFLTKDELRDAAMRELKVSKNAFDFAGSTRSNGLAGTIGTSRYVDDPAANANHFPIRGLATTERLPESVLCTTAVPSNVAYWGVKLTRYAPSEVYGFW